MDIQMDDVKAKTQSWTRYLNPFYFEIGFLRRVFYADLFACAGYACIILALLTVLLPVTIRIAHRPAYTMEQLNRVSDPVKLRTQILLENRLCRDAWELNVLGTICASIVLLGMIITLLCNAAYLRKAHQLLISKPQ